MNPVYSKSELTIVVLLRFMGIGGLLAIPAIFLPYSWMNAIHEYLGLGTLPDAPIVSYLTRSLSCFYAIAGSVTLFVSLDIRRHRSFVTLLAIILTVTGCVLLGIDIAAGMPTSWTISEGPPSIVIGLLVLWLQRKEANASQDHSEP